MNTIKINSGSVKMVAHRGLSGIERENTCPAFVAAANRSYFGIETDVHVTKDKKFVIIHDDTTTRVSLGNVSLNVEESNYEDLCNTVLPDKDESFDRQDIRIPLLSEYIRICKKYEKKCVLELKNHFEEEDLKSLIEQIKRLEYIDNVIFISFDLKNCLNTRKYLPENTVQWLVGEKGVDEETIKILEENRFDLDVYYGVVTSELVKELHAKGININCWTIDNPIVAERLVKMGVDYITTNILE
jgi:glycerophosphoryl diester phosphodiesterase